MDPRPAVFKRIALATFLCVSISCRAGQGSAQAAPRRSDQAIKLERPGLSNFYQITTNLYRGAQPTARGMRELKAMGIKTVVNLRTFHSDLDELAGTGLNQGQLQMQPWRAKDEDMVRFLKIVTDTNSLPVFVHCQRGADRTGTMCALYRIAVCGWTRQEAIQEMKTGGFGFNPTWQNLVIYLEIADIEKLKRRAGIPAKPQPIKARSK